MDSFMPTSAPSKAFLETVCRTCMCRIAAPHLMRIFSDANFYNGLPLRQVLKEITSTLMEPDDSLPSNICLKCAIKVRQSVAFKRSIEKSDTTLKQHLRKAQFLYLTKQSHSVAAHLNKVLDILYAEVAYLNDNTPEPSESQTQMLIAEQNSNITYRKPVDVNKVRAWQASIDKIVDGRICKLVKVRGSKMCNVRVLQNNSSVILPDTHHQVVKMKEQSKPNKTVFSGKQFVEELLREKKVQQIPLEIDFKSACPNTPETVNTDAQVDQIMSDSALSDVIVQNTEPIDTVIVLDTDDEDDCSAKVESVLTKQNKSLNKESVMEQKHLSETSIVQHKHRSETNVMQKQYILLEKPSGVENKATDLFEPVKLTPNFEEDICLVKDICKEVVEGNKEKHHIEAVEFTPDFDENINLFKAMCKEAVEMQTVSSSPEQPLTCSQCNRSFTSVPNLQRHLLYHSLNLELEHVRQVKNTCSYAENENAKIPIFVRRLEKCKYCAVELPYYSIPKHVRVEHKLEYQQQKKQQYLKQCLQSTTAKNSPKKVAIRRRRERKPYRCRRCRVSFASQDELAVHFRDELHLSKLRAAKNCRYRCEHCNEHFAFRMDLTKHMRQVHSMRMMSICYICGKMISTATISLHIRSHTNTKSIKCTVEGCSAMLKYHSSLRLHIKRVHSTEKPFMCERCGKAFTVSVSLRTHMRSHSDTLPFRCEICERGFQRMCNLKHHFRNQHQREKPYKCPECPQVFTYKQCIKKHCVRYHPEHPLAQNVPHWLQTTYKKEPTREKMYRCSICQGRFCREYSLRKHIRTFHPQLYYRLKQMQVDVTALGKKSEEDITERTD